MVSVHSGASTPSTLASATPSNIPVGFQSYATRSSTYPAQLSPSVSRRVVLHVEIHLRRGRHDEARALRDGRCDGRARRRPSPVGAARTPLLDDGRGLEPGVGDLLPADGPLAVASCTMACTRSMNGRVVAVGERLHFVAADVDVRPRRHRRQFAHHVVDEVVGDLLADAQRAEADLDARVERRRRAVAVQFRIRASAALVWPGMSISGTTVDVPRRRVRRRSRGTAPACSSRPAAADAPCCRRVRSGAASCRSRCASPGRPTGAGAARFSL